MKTIKQIGATAMLVALLGGLTTCGDMTTRQRDTAVGAGVGAAGSALSTLGGATVGGIIGNQVGK
ncbi:Osmotically inducible lipoprotein B precursor [Candidatus Burkholderia brachyanthoides]|nr:Osmotically inducible lipoprotein B precursor [Candidatus Burkholderia brachyanthoides]